MGVELTVGEALRSDIGLGRARVDETTRRILGVDPDDIVEIEGKKKTVASVRDAQQDEEGNGIIRIDGLIRHNAKVSLGDKVWVRKTSTVPAQAIEFAPVLAFPARKISFGRDIEDFMKRGILKKPLTQGDIIIVPGIALMGGAFPFVVLHTSPEGNVRVDETTSITLRKEPSPTR